MSESVEIKKEMQIQVDFVECKNCGKQVDFSLKSDSYGDLQITFTPCCCGSEEQI